MTRRLRVRLAQMLALIDRVFAPECPYCRQRPEACWCRGRDWLP